MGMPLIPIDKSRNQPIEGMCHTYYVFFYNRKKIGCGWAADFSHRASNTFGYVCPDTKVP